MNRLLPLPRWARLAAFTLLIVVACLLVAPTGYTQDVEPEGLVPGETVTYQQTIPVLSLIHIWPRR